MRCMDFDMTWDLDANLPFQRLDVNTADVFRREQRNLGISV